MTDNPLSLLRGARHEATDVELARATRRRILLEASAPKKRIAPWVVCLAAAVVAPAAWAGAHALLARSQSPASMPPMVSVAPAPRSVVSPVVASADPPLALSPIAAPIVSSSNPRVAAPRRAPLFPLDELTTFELAHRSHHHGADDAETALRRWDDYLARFPRGRFVPEALYARAVTLDRVGRFEEARAAFAPFARGDFGDYRRKEAIARLAEAAQRETSTR